MENRVIDVLRKLKNKKIISKKKYEDLSPVGLSHAMRRSCKEWRSTFPTYFISYKYLYI